MVREIAGTMPMYARVAVVLLVLLAGGYRIAQELRLFRCGCSCCLSDFLGCISGEFDGRRHCSVPGRRDALATHDRLGQDAPQDQTVGRNGGYARLRRDGRAGAASG